MACQSKYGNKVMPANLFHYENMPNQIYWKFHHQKQKPDKNSGIFCISAQNIDCG